MLESCTFCSIFYLFFTDDAQNPRSLQSMLADAETYCNPWGYEAKCK